jgi:hypothetical protein
MVRRSAAVPLGSLRALVALVALTFVSCVSTPRCPPSSGASGRAASASEVLPGDYALVMTATRGAERGASVRGTLRLVALDPAIDYRANVLLTGSVEIDFDAVAAPVLTDDTPPPGSTDPRAPGVLVISHGDLDGAGPGAVLVVGTSSNLYPVRERIEGDPEGGEIFHMVTDGAGIGLFVDRSRPGCFCGSWDRWGIVGEGSGSYCARRLP